MYKLLKDKYLRIVFGITIFIFLISATFAFAKFYNTIGPLIIHFDVFKGIDVVGNKWDVFGILFLAATMMALNFFIAEFIYERERLMSYLFSYGAMILSVLFLIAILAINSVNL